MNNNAALAWGGTQGFVGNGSNLIFGSASATNDVNFANAINLGAINRTILTKANVGKTNQAILNGVLSGTGGLFVNDGTSNGVLVTTVANTFTGGTSIFNGTLALRGAGALNSSSPVMVAAPGDFDISEAGNRTASSLTGAGRVSLGGNVLTLNEVGNTSFSGVIRDGGLAGGTGGGLTKGGIGTVTLSGASTYTGATNINQGSVILSGSLESSAINVASGTNLSVTNSGLGALAALTNAGTTTLASDDTVASLLNTGTLNGTGFTLTAGNYALNTGSVINANLGTGIVNSNGSVLINGISNGSQLNVRTGTTTLGSAERLADSMQVTVASAANLILGGAEKIGSLFGTGNVAIGGNRLTLDSGSFSGNVAGTGGLTKTSAGTFEILSALGYSGSTLVNAGTLSLKGDGALNPAGIINVASGADFDISQAGDRTTASLTGAGVVSLGDHTLTLDESGNTVFSGNIRDGGIGGGVAGGITKTGNGSVVLSGANTYTGVTQINNGSVVLSGSLGSLAVNVASGANLDVTNSGLSAGSALNNNGIVNLTSDDAVASFTNIGTLNGSSNTLTATTYALNNGSVINANLGTGIVNSNGSVAINGTSNGSDLNVQTGTTTLGSAERLADSMKVTLSQDANLVLGGLEKIGSLFGAGTLVNSGNRLTLDSGSFSGDISGNGGLTKVSTGTFEVLSALTYSGSTLINAGTLSLKGDGALNPAGIINVASAADFDISQAGNRTTASLTGAGFVSLGANILTLNESGDTLFSGVIRDGGLGSGVAGGITKTGNGKSTLSGANTYTGTTQVNNGSLVLSGSLESLFVNVASGASMDVTSSGLSALAALSNAGTLNLFSDDQVSSFSNTGTLNDNGFTLTAGTYALNNNTVINADLGTGIVNTNGTVLINGTSDGSQLNVQTGTTTLGAAERLIDSIQVTISENAALISGGAEKIGLLFGAGDLVNSGSRLTLDSGSFSGDISGTGGLTKVSADTFEVLSALTYSGSTLIDAGTLSLNGDGALNPAGVINVASAADFDISQAGDRTTASLAGAGFVSLGANILTLNEAGNTEFSGVIRDGGIGGGVAGGITKTGNGSVTLSGANTYTGTTQINNGSIVLTGSLESLVVNVASGTSLDVTNSGLASGSAVSNDGIINLTSDDTVKTYVSTGALNGSANTLTAGTYGLNGGSVVNANLGTGTVSSNGSVALNGTSSAQTVSILSGTTTLGSAERLLDTTDLSIATNAALLLGGSEKIGSLFGGGTLTNNGFGLTVDDGNFSGIVSGTGGLTKVSPGTLAITSAQSYTGATLISAGTVDLSGSLAGNSITIDPRASLVSRNGGLSSGATVTNNGTFDITATDDTIATVVNTGLISGTGTLTAGTYGLNGGSVVNANLGAGTVNTSGSVLLNGHSSAGIVNIATGSVLTTGSTERLLDSAVVTVDGKLSLGGAETFGNLFGSGTVDANGNLLNLSGGSFTGVINARDTRFDVNAATFGFVGGKLFTDDFNVINGGNASLTLASLAESDRTFVDGTSNLLVDATSILRSDVITVAGTLNTGSQNSLAYNTLKGTGQIVTNGLAFLNKSGSTVRGTLSFSDDFRNEGTFAPGNSPGLTTIGGNYTEAGRLEMELGSTVPITGHDQIRVGGSVTLASGSQLVVQTFAGHQPTLGNIYQIIGTGTGAPLRSNGTFSSLIFDIDGVAGSRPAGPSAAMIYDVATSQLISTGLNTSTGSFGGLGNTTNEGNVVNAIFGAALIGENQIDSSDPTIGSFVRDLLTNGGGAALNLSLFAPDYYGSMADYAYAGNDQMTSRLSDRISAPTMAGWDTYAGVSNNSFDTADGVDGDRTDMYVGADHLVAPGVKLGGTVSYNTGDISANLGKGDADGYGISIYGTAALSKELTVFAITGYSDQQFDLDRPTQQGQVSGSTDATSFLLGAGARYLAYQKDGFSVAPQAMLSYEQAQVDGFDEAGAADALRHNGYDANRLFVDLGTSAMWETKMADRPFRAEVIVGVRQILSDSQDQMRTTVINNPAVSYDIGYEDDASTLFNAALNFSYGLTDQSSIYAGYETLIGSETSNKFNLGYRYSF